MGSVLTESARKLVLLLAVVVGIQVLYFSDQPVPPHSSHDGYSLVPQLQKLAQGRSPDDPAFGMFEGTWFPPVPAEDVRVGWRPFTARLLGNVRPHTWVDAPHPLALASASAALVPGQAWVPGAVITGYFLLLLVALYFIGCRVSSSSVGVLAATLAAGSPGLFGMSRYVETHLPLVAVATTVVAVLMYVEGLKRWGLCFIASVLTWSLTRSGEAAGEVIIGGLLVVGPGLATLWHARRSGPVKARLLGLACLILPAVILADLEFLRACMESVTRAFADPAVQTDVVDKGGTLGSAWTWRGAYLVLIVTDYIAPLLALFIPLAAWGLWSTRKTPQADRVRLGLWMLVPLLALSWMQRKAGWYGIGLIPPLVLWMALGLDQVPRGRRWVVGAAVGVSLLQLSLGSLVPADAVPDGLAGVRQPIPVHDWRLRRVDLLRPVDTPAHRRLATDARALLSWLDEAHPPTGDLLYLAAVIRGSGSDYPLKTMIELSRPDVVVLNLTDPRARRIAYRGFTPDDFVALIHVGEGLDPWPPTAAQSDWLRANLQCRGDDPLDAFLGAVLARGLRSADAAVPVSVLGPGKGEVVGPGRLWRPRTQPKTRGLCGR